MQWFLSLSQWLDGMTPWFALGGGLAAIVAYAFGLPKVLGILEKVIDIVSPILKFVAETFVAVIKWLWNTVYKAGLGDIIDNWRTIVTVLTIVGGMALFMDARMDARIESMTDKLEFCQSENTRLERLAKKQGLSTQPAGPFDWLFKW